MKRKRNLIIMGIVFVALCIVIVVENLVTEHVDSINTTDEIILSVDVGEVTVVSWTYDDESLSFTNKDGTWYDSDDADFPVIQSEIEDFLTHFEEVHASFIIEDVSNYSQYGLDEPECTVTITDADGETVISMGDYSTMDEQRYISIGDGKVYLIEDDLIDYVVTDRDEFIQLEELPTVDTVEEIDVSGDADVNIVYDPDGVYSYTDDYNYYLISDDEHLALDDGDTENYIKTVQGIELSDYVSYTASSDDLSVYGLDNPAYAVTISGTTEVESDDDSDDETSYEDVQYTLYIGYVYDESEDDDDDDSEDSDSDDEESILAYVRLDDSNIIYSLDESTFNTISGISYESLRPVEVLSLDWTQVTGVSISFGGDTYDFEIMSSSEWEGTDDSSDEDTSDDDLVYILNDEEVDFDEIKDAIDALKVTDFSDDEGEDDAELSLTIYLDNDDYPQISVDIYQYDGDSSLVVMDGETLGYMKRSRMVDLREAVTSAMLGSAE